MELQTPKLLFSPEAVLKFEMLLYMATFAVLCIDDTNVETFFANQEAIVKDAKYWYT